LGGLLPEHTDESQVGELADGQLLLNMRSYWGRVAKRADRDGKRALSRSGDGGVTWSELEFDDTLIEPVCQASFLRYTHAESDGKNRLLFSNPASKTQRVQMTVRLSYDEGKSWPVSKLLHEGPSAYSSLAVLPDRSIACVYERGDESAYETLTFARFTLDWLTDGEDSIGR
jgi:sialidase-1